MIDDQTRVALEVSSQFTALIRCESDVPVECLGSVSNDDPEFDMHLAKAVSDAKPLIKSKLTKEIWLDEDQIVLRHIRLEAKDGAQRRAEAADALSAITPYQPEDLSFTLGEEDTEGYTPVAAVPIRKLDEISALARAAGFRDAVVTSTDDIDGFLNRPVWSVEKAAASTSVRFAQVAAFFLALSLPFVFASAANHGQIGAQLRSLLAFTPSVSAPRAEVQVASVDREDASTPAVQAPRDGAVAALGPQTAPGAWTGFVQRHVRELGVPAKTRAVELNPPRIMPGIDSPLVPARPKSYALPQSPVPLTSAFGNDDKGLAPSLTGISFLRAGLAAPSKTHRFGGIRVANLDVVLLNDHPRLRPFRRAAIAPIILAVPKIRPLPPLPEEIFGSKHLPVVRTPISAATAGLVAPQTTPALSRYSTPAVVAMDVIEADVAASMADAYRIRRETAIVAAANREGSPGSTIGGPRLRNIVPIAALSGARVQTMVDTLNFVAVSNSQTVVAPRKAAPLNATSAQPELQAAIPVDMQGAMDAQFERRAETARLASLMSNGTASTLVPRRREVAPEQSAAPQAAPAPAPAQNASVAGLPVDGAQMTLPRNRRVETNRPVDPAPLGGTQASAGVIVAYLPLHRPDDLAEKAAAILKKRKSAAAVVAARQTPRSTTPGDQLRIPTSARVASVATIRDGIDLGDLSLIGIFGKSNDRHALLRTSQGRIEKVKRGERVSGWVISSIGDDGVRIQKRSQTKVLRLPN